MNFLEVEQRVYQFRGSMRDADTLKESEELVDNLLVFLNEELVLREGEWKKCEEIIENLDGTLTFVKNEEVKKKLNIQKRNTESKLTELDEEMVKIREHITQFTWIHKSFDIFYKNSQKKVDK